MLFWLVGVGVIILLVVSNRPMGTLMKMLVGVIILLVVSSRPMGTLMKMLFYDFLMLRRL